MTSHEPLELVYGSGNIWRDLGYSDAEERQAKGILGAQIIGVMNDRKLSPRQACECTGFRSLDFSRVRRANFQMFSVDHLTAMLRALGG